LFVLFSVLLPTKQRRPVSAFVVLMAQDIKHGGNLFTPFQLMVVALFHPVQCRLLAITIIEGQRRLSSISARYSAKSPAQ